MHLRMRLEPVTLTALQETTQVEQVTPILAQELLQEPEIRIQAQELLLAQVIQILLLVEPLQEQETLIPALILATVETMVGTVIIPTMEDHLLALQVVEVVVVAAASLLPRQ